MSFMTSCERVHEKQKKIFLPWDPDIWETGTHAPNAKPK
jgi:hypothetical protein